MAEWHGGGWCSLCEEPISRCLRLFQKCYSLVWTLLAFYRPKGEQFWKESYFSENGVSHSGFPAPGDCAERLLPLPCLRAWGCSSSGCQESAGCRQAQCIWSESCQGLARLPSTHLSKFLTSVGLASERYIYTDIKRTGFWRSGRRHTATPEMLTHRWLQLAQQMAALARSANVTVGWSLPASTISL